MLTDRIHLVTRTFITVTQFIIFVFVFNLLVTGVPIVDYLLPPDSFNLPRELLQVAQVAYFRTRVEERWNAFNFFSLLGF